MFCTSCGERVTPDTKFCADCGTRVAAHPRPVVSEDDFDRSLPTEEQVRAFLDRAIRARSLGRLTEAISLATQAAEADPASTGAHSMLGQLYERVQDRDRAIEHYRRVVELNPGSIADRIKLDQLIDNAPTPPPGAAEPASQRHISGLAAAAVALAIGIIVGAGVWGRHGDGKPDAVPAMQAAAVPPRAATQGPVAAPVPAPAPAGVARGAVMQDIGVPAAPPPIVVYDRAEAAPRVVRVRQAPAAPPPAPLALPAAPAAPARAADGHYVIPVDTVQAGRQRDVAAAAESEGKIIVSVTRRPDAPAAEPSTESSESRTYAAMARDAALREDWPRAIQAYLKAAPAAGDNAAYIHEQLGLCYQRAGDRANAVVHFKRAIDAYQRLTEAGHQPDSSRSAIKVCEQGIRICSGQ